MKQYSCNHCGYSPRNRRDWCDLGCGRDYNEMIEIKQLIKQKLELESKNIRFDKVSHTYWLGQKQLISVSALIKLVTPEFDPTGQILIKCALKEGVSPETLKARWEANKDKSCLEGTEAHEIFEAMLTHQPIPNNAQKRLETVLKPCVEAIQPYLICSELLIYDEDLMVAGTPDAICLTENKIAIIDLKTNKEPITSLNKYKQYLLPPLNHLPNIPYYKYSIALSLYAYLLEKKGYTINTDELEIEHVYQNEVQPIKLKYLRDEVIQLIKYYHEMKE